jgi:adenosylcobinamide-phosphate synthase
MTVLIHNAITILWLAALLDYWIGDPWGWPHPVRAMGWIIATSTALILQHCKLPWQQQLAGIGLGLSVILGSGAVGWGMVQVSARMHPVLGWGVSSIILASCFAGRSLRAAADDVLQPLQEDDLPKARLRLRQYVGRDTDGLDQPELLRAMLETVTENATDGVTAPLFYALLGAFLPGIGSVPLALAYKAASTLDSMVGYRTPPYTQVGWFSARFEDGLTWVPCRCTVLTLALASGRPRTVWRICRRDASIDPSPNSGWSEAAYAAILGVQVGGTNWYRGVPKQKPLLGDPGQAIAPVHIHQALHLTRRCVLLWLSLGTIALLINANYR